MFKQKIFVTPSWKLINKFVTETNNQANITTQLFLSVYIITKENEKSVLVS